MTFLRFYVRFLNGPVSYRIKYIIGRYDSVDDNKISQISLIYTLAANRHQHRFQTKWLWFIYLTPCVFKGREE